ncbi:MAG: hypothetical protein AAGK02_17310, partial [Pseudomonadota bacterium]
SARQRIVLATMGAQDSSALLRGLGTVESRLLGDAQCTDDLYLWSADTPLPVSVEDAFSSSASRVIGTGWWDESTGRDGYEIELEGTRRVLPLTNGYDAPSRIFSDREVSMSLGNKGASLSDGAFGFTVYEMTLTYGGASETATVLNLGGC